MRRVGKTAARWLAEYKARPSDWATDALWRLSTFAMALGGSQRAKRAMAYARGRYHLNAALEDASCDWPGVRSGMSARGALYSLVMLDELWDREAKR